MQSRKYEKKLEDGTVLEKTAYEVSVSQIEINKEESIACEGVENAQDTTEVPVAAAAETPKD